MIMKKWMYILLATVILFNACNKDEENNEDNTETATALNLTSSSFPAAGETFLLAYDTVIGDTTLTIGEAGTNQTWDFSSLEEDDTSSFYFRDPANTPNGADFPTSTVAIVPDDELTMYGVKDASKIEIIGVATDINGTGNKTGITFSNNLTYYSFPMTYQTEFEDQGAFTYVTTSPYADSIKTQYDSEIDSKIDAWGTVITPKGTFNCLREKRKEITQIVVSAYMSGVWQQMFSELDTVYTYSYFASEHHFPVLQIETDEDDNIIEANFIK